ncbi:MAG: ABC transporter permease [Sphingobacteriia bacterium 24-36-13]|uniref:ABC transporter permease n=1 Tax=Sediminibacterium sp. TaxID=1917865 RepID=UPI000BC5BD4C|nr:ABC transporter permease [Sediminibacterium sp.]OYZ55015.1 MAG: ABC transporter permease [Sphingobacteriia bacterium 24-36-13]OZA66457.1 MAG: ABC transporter permease [Sphingobacteriia bacterium 39-36-14]HQS23046.1 ABC transporter permease [Sediminibacterium sp.]HQS33842.1 ABC transporter permease [Sediminibacterium sp.]
MQYLLKAEIYKLFKQSKTYYALGALFSIELLILFSAYYQGTTIIDLLLENLKQKFYFEGTLLNGNLLIYLILNTLWFHLPLILMIIVSGTLTSEYKDRTIQTIMLQPVSKWKFILSKYLVAIGFTMLVVGLLAASSFGLSYAFFGKGDLVVYLNGLNFFDATDAIKRLQWSFISGALSMVFFSIASLTIAILFKEATKTWIVSAFFLILSNILLKVDFGDNWFNQLFFAKLNDTWQYFFYYTINWQQIIFNSALSLAYCILFMGVGIYWFHKKDIG